MEPINVNPEILKQRHGCVTAWLIFMIVANSMSAVFYLFFTELIVKTIPDGMPKSLIMALGIIGVANILFSVLLFQWRKIAFWGFVGTSLCSMLINLSNGLGVGQSLAGLFGVAVLYAVLQIRKDNISAWENLR